LVSLGDGSWRAVETLTGLAGLGIVLTCNGALSRNRQVGIDLGKGRALGEILAGMRMVAEVLALPRSPRASSRTKVELPITEVAPFCTMGKPRAKPSAT